MHPLVLASNLGGVSFLRRQTVIAALTANALRPPHGRRSGLAAFGAGMVFGETAPQVLALTALDAAAHLTRDRRKGFRSKAGLAVWGALTSLSAIAALFLGVLLRS